VNAGVLVNQLAQLSEFGIGKLRHHHGDSGAARRLFPSVVLVLFPGKIAH
jgi:hypothetical protein